MTRMAFRFMAAQLDRDLVKWEETCRKRSEAGKKSAEVRARAAKSTNVDFVEQCLTNPTDTESESESVSESEAESVSETEPETDFDSDSETVAEAVSVADAVPPPVDAVAAYCAERHNNIDAQKFWDYYAARGWMLGRERMADWRAVVRSWERRERASPPLSEVPQTMDSGVNDLWLEDFRRYQARQNAPPEKIPSRRYEE